MFHMSNKLIFKQKIQDENALVTEENFGSWTTLLNQVNLNRIISKSTAMLYTFMCCGVLFFLQFYCTVTFFFFLIPIGKMVSFYEHFGLWMAFRNKLNLWTEVPLCVCVCIFVCAWWNNFINCLIKLGACDQNTL